MKDNCKTTPIPTRHIFSVIFFLGLNIFPIIFLKLQYPLIDIPIIFIFKTLLEFLRLIISCQAHCILDPISFNVSISK